MLGSGQDKWLLQVKTNRGPCRFFFFFSSSFPFASFGATSLCVSTVHTHMLCFSSSALQHSSGLWMIQNEELKLKWCSADTSASHVPRTKGGTTAFKSITPDICDIAFILKEGERHAHILQLQTHTCTQSEHPGAYWFTLQLTTIKVLAFPRAAVNPALGFFSSAVSPGHLPVCSSIIICLCLWPSNAYYELL